MIERGHLNYGILMVDRLETGKNGAVMGAKAICGSCHQTVEGYGSVRKNSKGQHLVSIRPHWKAGEVGGTVCNARVGVVAK